MNSAPNIPGHIEVLAVEQLVPYARNSRTHSEEQVAQIAASIREFGFTNPVLINAAGGIIAGHGRVMGAKAAGLKSVPCIRLAHLTPEQERAYVIADNQLAMNSGWDRDLLALELRELGGAGFPLDLLGFDSDALDQLLASTEDDLEAPDEPPEQDPSDEAPPPDRSELDVDTTPLEQAITRPGDVWRLGPHRVMCGDSTNPADVAKLVAGRKAQLLHADPPYGMGKEAEGVANDNLRGIKLDAFQLQWWAAFRPHLLDNASAYIWGNAPDLWRLWYRGGLADTERLELRNELVWDKTSVPGMASPDLTQFPEASERCLFLQFGDQFLGNINAGDFPETWEPLRSYMEGQARAAGMNAADLKRLCGVGMYGHWFTRSQFNLIPERHYLALRRAYPGNFDRPWEDLKAEWDRVKGGPTSEIQCARSYFDNAHEPMTDVWKFSRVLGDDRHGHATPKPVAMMERAIKSTTKPGWLVLEPFGGSGSTLIGAAVCGRHCYAMELQPRYCDVIIRRWQAFTGQQATLEATGEAFDDLAAAAAQPA